MQAESSNQDPLSAAETWLREGRKVVLATVVSTWGSAPRRAGSHLVVDGDGNFAGSVSGGCVEGAVITEAAEAIAAKRHRLLEFEVSDETALRVGLSCGGQIKVLVQPVGEGLPLDLGVIAALNAARAKRSPMVLASDLATGAARLVVGEVTASD